MYKAWREIEGLLRRNAKHRKGFRLQEVTYDSVLQHALEEVQELRDNPDDITELGDAIACLLHYAIRHGWHLDQLEQAIVDKLVLRFPDDEEVGHSGVNGVSRTVRETQRRQRSFRG